MGVTGADACELIVAYGAHFDVDVSNLLLPIILTPKV